MRRVWGVIFLALSVACTSWAQQASSDTVPAAKEDIQKLFAALHLTEMMRNVMTASMQQSKQLAHDTIKKKQPDVTEEQLKRMDAFIDNFTKTLDINGMLDDMIPVYRHHLTKQDVNAMLAFYDTPTGQKILREQPAMMAEGMQAMRPRMEKMMSDMTDQAENVAKEMSDSTPTKK